MEDNKNALKLLYGGSVILGGSIAGIWAFGANRFRISECIVITGGGMIAGIGFGLVCYAIISLLRK